jgi:hypothetical protein
MKKRLPLLCAAAVVLALLLPLGVSAKLSCAVDQLTEQAELIKTGILGEEMTFTDADFRQALGVTTYPSITLVTLPAFTDGVLKLNGLRVSAGQTIARADISGLTFTPATDMVTDSSFTFRVGELCGGATLRCSLKLIEQVNAAPTSGGGSEACFSLYTQKNISVFGTLSGYDPEGDQLTYLIITYPERGSLTVTDALAGDFRYTPRAGFTGKDSFTYVVRDSYGNYSAPATVRIQVDKGVADLDYFDTDPALEGGTVQSTEVAPEEALQYLVRRHILMGDAAEGAIGDPSEVGITRVDFLCAAMKATGQFTTASGAQTIFDDEEAIPSAARATVAKAQQLGYVSGVWREGGLYFSPDECITVSEALAILSRMLPDTAVATLTSLGEGNTPISRSQAALFLYRAATTL